MTTPLSIPCEEMKAEDFFESWTFFLRQLGSLGEDWIRDRGGILADGLLSMWRHVIGGLLERSHEITDAANSDRENPMFCQIIWGIGAWDPTGPFGGIGGGVPGAFVSARMIKEAIERWLGQRLSPETNELLRALNQLLCMLRCL